jgi:hypothetical protein
VRASTGYVANGRNQMQGFFGFAESVFEGTETAPVGAVLDVEFGPLASNVADSANGMVVAS